MDAERAWRAAQAFLLCYQELSAEAFRTEQLRWKTRPKIHYFAHMVDYMKACRRNPSAHHCFGEEDFIGKVLTVACSTHGRTVMVRALQRYRLYVSLRWEKQRRMLQQKKAS